MKKNIFYTIQSAEMYFLALLTCCKTALLKIYWENVVIKRFLYYNMLLFMSLFFTVNSYGQTVGAGAIRANFGVDGDAYANFQGFSIQYPTVPPPAPVIQPPQSTPGVDDWFMNRTPLFTPDSLSVKTPFYDGSGLNVISQKNAAAHKTAIQQNNNATFTERQSRHKLGDPNVLAVIAGFPVVQNDGGVPYLWLDAVYGRDSNAAQGNSDSSMFTSTSDKNPDNPSTWNLGIGSVPQKTDIIDVMAHIRGITPHDPRLNPGFPEDDRPFDELWVFAAATLRETNGSKHIDFEFFRTLVEYTQGGTTMGNTGPASSGGRDAFTFNSSTGARIRAGAITASIDYENGGVNPDVRIRVWMSRTSYNLLLTNPGGRPFNVIPGTFETGEKTTLADNPLVDDDYGYVRITALTSDLNDPAIFGRVNAEGSTLATPWGTLAGEKADFFDEYQTFQHVEIGINLTRFGLDRRNTNDPCANILGSLLVKTRSCAGGNNDPFTCELKDFAGPFPFGSTLIPPTPNTTPLTACFSSGQTFNLTQRVDATPDGTVDTFYKNKVVGGVDQADTANPILGASITSYADAIIGENKIWVRRVYAGSECGNYASFIITVNAASMANAGGPNTVCTSATPSAITLAGASIGGGATTGAWSIVSGGGTLSSTAQTATPATVTYTPAANFVGTVTLRLTTNALAPCAAATADRTINVVPTPTCGITGEQTICSGGSSTFTATEGMTSYAWTGPNSFIASTQSINVSVAGIYYVTITNGNGCQSTCSRELMVVSCGGPVCTYTQGAYGNSGGKYCDGTEGGISTTDLITQAIANAGGSITVGKPGSSVMMNSGGENCIITQMPGGGKATEIFPAGDYDICPSLPNNFLKNGKINNVLLSQTIALSLNVNITKPSQLGSFVLQPGTLATAKPEGGCDSSIAKARVCGHFEDNVWVNTENEYTYRTFSAAVINAINGDKTVAGLLDLANRALANVDGIKNSEGGASLSDIAGAVAAVNEVFDECAIAVGWDIEKCPEPPTLDLSSVTTAKISSVESASFTAYPVPFKDQLTIRYDFDYTSDVTIEVFNSKGIIVYSMTDTGSFLGKEVTIMINNTLQQQQVYYVRLTTSQGSTVKSVMSSY